MVVADRWHDGGPYERYIGRWSRPVADRFLESLDAERGIRWVDVGCGTGALTAAVVERYAPSSIVGVDPSEGFLAAARDRPGIVGRPEVRFVVGDAQHLPLPDGAADAVVSGLVLNFVPDAAAAVAEFSRVAAPGGLIAAYVWDYSGGMRMLRHFWDAAAAVDPAAVALDEGRRFPICDPQPLRDLWSAAPGMDGDSVRVDAIDVETVFSDFDDLWSPFLGGQGPAPSYLASATDAARTAVRDRMRATVEPATRPDGSIALNARAWAIVGRRS
ncbi:class I SAM-dependent methyltransferase [Agromyces binzhouensis]|uniref:Methyltransferase domain-containing protein n=1 Tax=Agromyces binzhouensis TaxID=1817495 RepID=A0A4Q2JVZ3_9MICO|nr:class I SAM-dependent methyltransferase [Agromyces binzhouensis]RXZ51386.1 methyltransferase domain-containing protein [Agromyces binzhouensis]